MPVKERSDYKTEEIKYKEYYCDRCDGLIGKNIDEDQYTVTFFRRIDQIWCDGCIDREVDGEKRALLKMYDVVEGRDMEITFSIAAALWGMNSIGMMLYGLTVVGAPMWEAIVGGLFFGSMIFLVGALFVCIGCALIENVDLSKHL